MKLNIPALAYMLTYMSEVNSHRKAAVLRTTVYFDEDIGLSLKRLANLRGRPQAELIREALKDYIERAEAGGGNKLPPGVAQYQSGRSDVSSRVDEILTRAARKRR
jgi:predicted transcriptional regulator